MKFVCGLTLLGALEVQGQLHEEPRCDFGALMAKMRDVTEHGMPISDLQTDSVFQACERVAQRIAEVQIASSCPGGGGGGGGGGGAYPAGSCGDHAWGEEQDGNDKCWSPFKPFPEGDAHLYDTFADSPEMCCNAEDYCDYTWATDRSRLCKFWEGTCPADHYKRGSWATDCDGHEFAPDGPGPEEECCLPTCASWGGQCDEANGWWYKGDEHVCWGPDCTEDHCCATSCSANFNPAECDAMSGMRFEGDRQCHDGHCQPENCCVNSCHSSPVYFECPAGTERIHDTDIPNFATDETSSAADLQGACCVTRCHSLPGDTCPDEQWLTHEHKAICTDTSDCAASCCERPCSDLQVTCPTGATPIPPEKEPYAVPSNAEQMCCMYTCDANTQCPDAGMVVDPNRDCNWGGHNPDECHDPGHCCAPTYEVGSIAADWFQGAAADRTSTWEIMAFSDPDCTVPADGGTEQGNFEGGSVAGTSGECASAVWMSTETKEHCDAGTCTTETEVETRVVAATAYCGGPNGARAFEYNHGGRAGEGSCATMAPGDLLVDAGGGLYFEGTEECRRPPGDDDEAPYFKLTCN